MKWNAKTMKSSNTAANLFAAWVLTFLFAQSVYASQNQDWLNVERLNTYTTTQKTEFARRAFFESSSVAAAVSRDVRSMLEGSESEFKVHVSDLESSEEIQADQWLAGLPKSKPAVPVAQAATTECTLNQSNGQYECATWNITTQLTSYEPQVMILAPTQAVEIDGANKNTSESGSMASRHAGIISDDSPGAEQNLAQEKEYIDARAVKFFRGPSGLVTTEGGRVTLNAANEVLSVQLAPEVKRNHVSMFVRDPAVLIYDQKTNRLTAQRAGSTELFVVSRDRISIIPVSVKDKDKDQDAAVAAVKKSQLQNKVATVPDMGLPAGLASIDTLDKSAGIHAMYGQNMNGRDVDVKSSYANRAALPDDLTVPAEATSLPANNDDASVTFVRAKAKASFGRMYVRVVDERSQWNGSRLYPVGGLRVKLIGTEYESRTDGQGYIEISDMPAGSRLFAEIIDDSGATMPGFAEIVYDPSAMSKERAQLIMVRRYLSLDYAARMAGQVQNMEKSSLCGTLVDSSVRRQPLAGVRVGVDVASIGPFYFNDLGYLDTRMSESGSSGRYCFFNVEPGPVSIGISRRSESAPQVVVTVTARGYHVEDLIGLDDARHLTTTAASVGTAAEQLSSDIERSNKYLPVEQAELVTIGSEDQMLPIDEGVYTSATPLIPLRGRVWTVAHSNDFEASVQAASVKLPGSRQITSLLPRGFIDDMTNYAQQYQDPDLGAVVVEHAGIQGQGSNSVKLRLVDMNGHDAGDGWYFSDAPVAKAVFFNVPPGAYAVVVETNSGYWLAADTAVVYGEVSTYVRTGAPLEKHLLTTSASN